MKSRNWKRVEPTSFANAIELCKDYAAEVENLSVARIADLMGEHSQHTVYGWLNDGSIPGRKIAAYQHVCNADFITRWLAHGEGKLLVSVPVGRLTSTMDVNLLQEQTNLATAALIHFAAGKASEADTIAALTRAMEALAWHRVNVAKISQPELDLGGAA
jgi:hypothetical protein